MSKAFKHFRQPDQMDCGITCLKMVANFYGANYAISYLREHIPSSKFGTNLPRLESAAKALGFNTLISSGTVEELARESILPAILFWTASHFVVLHGIEEKTINGVVRRSFLISDPAFKNYTLSEEDFTAKWIDEGQNKTGLILFLEPQADFISQYNSYRQSYVSSNKQFVKAYIISHKWNFGRLLLITIITSLLNLSFPILTQKIVDVGIPSKNLSFISLVLVIQITAFLGNSMFELMKSKVLFGFTTQMNIDKLSQFLHKLTRLPIKYFDHKMTSDITQRVADHSRIERFVSSNLLTTLFSVVNLLLYTVLILRYDFLIFLLFLSVTVLSVVWMATFISRRNQLEYERFEAYSTTSNSVFELVFGMKELKLNNAQNSKIADWQRDQQIIHKLNQKSLNLEQQQTSGNVLINQVRSALITFYSAYLVIHGRLTLGEMLSISYMLGQLSSPFTQFFDFIKSWNEALFSFERINEIHLRKDEDRESLPSNMERGNLITNFNQIKVTNVSFKYDEHLPNFVLQDINIEIKKGQTIAIVGNSGSGKTTLLKMLLKFYLPSEGTIYIDDQPLTHIQADSWRAMCGAVLQDGYIFSASIIKNIALDSTKMDIDRVHYVCKLANIAEYIESLPLKYETRIGSSGTGLSGGQIQRILIARALYGDPEFFLFDEATSSLDTENEMIIMKNIMEFCKEKTLVVIAHRLSTVKNADNIYVLNNGRVIESGNHNELYAMEGFYNRLISNQLNIS